MTDYKSLYYGLFNSITDVINAMEKTLLNANDERLCSQMNAHIDVLRQLQFNAEEEYINQK